MTVGPDIALADNAPQMKTAGPGPGGGHELPRQALSACVSTKGFTSIGEGSEGLFSTIKASSGGKYNLVAVWTYT